MSFFNSLYNSLYNFKWLRQQRDNTSWAWSYFFLLTFFVTGLIVIPTAFKYFSDAPNWKATVSREIPEFQAQMKNGQLAVTGLSQPYIKKYDKAVIVVDTVSTTTISVQQFVSDGALGILATKDRIEVYNPQDKTTKTEVFAAGNDFQIDRNFILNWTDKILNNKTLTLFTLAFSVVIFLYLFVGSLLNIFFISLVFYYFGKKRNLDYKFKQVFCVGLFAVTLPMILDQLISVFPLMSLVWSLMLGVWMYWALFKSEK